MVSVRSLQGALHASPRRARSNNTQVGIQGVHGVLKTASRPVSTPTIRRICVSLARSYGNPRHGNKRNPLNELVYIILSNRSRDPAFRSAYRALRRAYPSWNRVTRSCESDIANILRPYGLASLKARTLVEIMSALRREFGYPTLRTLRDMETDEAEAVLISLPGVGAKVAKCVLMYALDRPVLPVDVHVHRVAARLGLEVKKRPDTSQRLIEDAVPARLRYSFHVNLLAHGRRTCLPRTPRCGDCCIAQFCKYYQAGSQLQ